KYSTCGLRGSPQFGLGGLFQSSPCELVVDDRVGVSVVQRGLGVYSRYNRNIVNSPAGCHCGSACNAQPMLRSFQTVAPCIAGKDSREECLPAETWKGQHEQT